jgi:hypothetical protein
MNSLQIKEFSASELPEYIRDFLEDSKFFVRGNTWIRSFGHYAEKLSVICPSDWVNTVNKFIQEANMGKGKWSVTDAKDFDDEEVEDVLWDWRNDIIEEALEKCQRMLKAV